MHGNRGRMRAENTTIPPPTTSVSKSSTAQAILFLASMLTLLSLGAYASTLLRRRQKQANILPKALSTPSHLLSLSASPIPPPLHFPPLDNKLISEYVSWHNAQRLCLEYNRQGCAPTLIWTCPAKQSCGGAGDRLRGITFAYLLAVACRRVLLIDWSNPYPLESALRPAYLDWTLPPHLAAKRARVNITNPRSALYLNVSTLKWFNCDITVHHSCSIGHRVDAKDLPSYPVIPLSKWTGTHSLNLHIDNVSALLIPYHTLAITTRISLSLDWFLKHPHLHHAFPALPSNHRHPHFRFVFRAISHLLFRPSVALQKRMSEFEEQLGRDYDAVHARLGEDVGEAMMPRFQYASEHHNSTALALQKCLEKVRVSRGGEGGKVYLASDSIAFKKVFMWGQGVVTEHARALHVSKQQKRMSKEGFFNIFRDMMLLAGGQAIVGLHSGFANSAVYLGDTSTHVVVNANSGKCEVRNYTAWP